MHKTKGITSILGLSLTLVMGGFCFYEYKALGFPDGHLSEYDRFLKSIMCPLFFSINILFLIGFLWSLIKGIKNYRFLVLYLIFIVLFSLITWYFAINLESGQGG